MDKYVLIGGAACNLLEEELDMNPRSTKALNLVLVVEALTPDFGARLWDFIKSANYAGRSIYNFPDCRNIVVCGDIHGDFNLLVNKVCVQYLLTVSQE